MNPTFNSNVVVFTIPLRFAAGMNFVAPVIPLRSASLLITIYYRNSLSYVATLLG